MNLYDYKALQFKDELMNLLKKYKYDISGTSFDDGSINIEDKSSGNIYHMKDECSNYNICKEIFVEGKEYDYEYIDIMEEYILSNFKKEKLSFDTSKMSIGVITASQEKAGKIFEEISNFNKRHIKRYVNTIHHKEILFNDDINRIVWVKPYQSVRGCKFKGAYIDKDISLETFETLIRPICIFCKRGSIKVI